MNPKNETQTETTKLPPTESTNVEIGEDSVLYIRIADFQGGTERAKMQCDKVRKKFEEALPGITVLVGIGDLRFSTITKKQEFVGRLDGQIQDE